MSEWARGLATAATYKIMGRCRSIARQKKGALKQLEAGNDGKAQAMFRFADDGHTLAERKAMAGKSTRVPTLAAMKKDIDQPRGLLAMPRAATSSSGASFSLKRSSAPSVAVQGRLNFGDTPKVSGSTPKVSAPTPKARVLGIASKVKGAQAGFRAGGQARADRMANRGLPAPKPVRTPKTVAPKQTMYDRRHNAIHTEGTVVEAFGKRFTSTGRETTARNYPAVELRDETGRLTAITRASQYKDEMRIIGVPGTPERLSRARDLRAERNSRRAATAKAEAPKPAPSEKKPSLLETMYRERSGKKQAARGAADEKVARVVAMQEKQEVKTAEPKKRFDAVSRMMEKAQVKRDIANPPPPPKPPEPFKLNRAEGLMKAEDKQTTRKLNREYRATYRALPGPAGSVKTPAPKFTEGKESAPVAVKTGLGGRLKKAEAKPVLAAGIEKPAAPAKKSTLVASRIKGAQEKFQTGQFKGAVSLMAQGKGGGDLPRRLDSAVGKLPAGRQLGIATGVLGAKPKSAKAGRELLLKKSEFTANAGARIDGIDKIGSQPAVTPKPASKPGLISRRIKGAQAEFLSGQAEKAIYSPRNPKSTTQVNELIGKLPEPRREQVRLVREGYKPSPAEVGKKPAVVPARGSAERKKQADWHRTLETTLRNSPSTSVYKIERTLRGKSAFAADPQTKRRVDLALKRLGKVSGKIDAEDNARMWDGYVKERKIAVRSKYASKGRR
jgi:hypothetical protein